MTIRWITPQDLGPTYQGRPEAQSIVDSASWILWKLTGEKYAGPARVTEWYGTDLRRCPQSCLNEAVLRSLLDYSADDRSSSFLRLRRKPVHEIHEVIMNDRVLDPTEYAIANGGYIRFRSWTGLCWDLESGITVDYTYGAHVPAAGREAAISFSEEIFKSIDGTEGCQLPSGATSVSRQGIDIELVDTASYVRDGKTGIALVDLFIQAANPGGKALKRPKIFSPRLPRGERYN